MGHPAIDNSTPFAFEPVFIADEELRPVVVTVLKATFNFSLDGAISLADEQMPVSLAGEPWTDAAISSYKYEPEVALSKLATDVVLIGHVFPPGNGAAHVDVGIKLGPVQKVARVFGDRFWVWSRNEARMSRPTAVGPVALCWENAFGGHDARRSTPERTILESRNPVGTGFGQPLAKEGERLRLPNIEDPNQPITEYGAIVTPCGFGFISPNWEPRATFAGTYDERWNESRKPMLPTDFDRRFFNAAAPGLIAPGYLRGGEEVVLLNTASTARLAFHLPMVPPPNCRVVLRGRQDRPVQMNLDTVIVNADEKKVMLLWRGFALGGPHDVSAIAVAAD